MLEYRLLPLHLCPPTADRALLSRFFSLPRLMKDLDVICKFITRAIDKVHP
jgi:hypothetical protein